MKGQGIREQAPASAASPSDGSEVRAGKRHQGPQRHGETHAHPKAARVGRRANCWHAVGAETAGAGRVRHKCRASPLTPENSVHLKVLLLQ